MKTQDIREEDLKAKQIVIVEKDGRIHLIPQKPIKEMRGFIKRMDTKHLRDEKDRL